MPILKLITNLPEERLPKDFEMLLSGKLAECVTQWGEEKFMVLVLPGQRMIKSRSEEPNAAIHLYCCYEFNDKEENRKISRILIDFASSELGIPKDRIVLVLRCIKTHHCGLADGVLVCDL